MKVLIVSALCWACLSGWLRRLLLSKDELVQIGVLRMARILREWGDELLGVLAGARASFKPRDAVEVFREQLRDPNDMRERAFAIPAIVEYSCGSDA